MRSRKRGREAGNHGESNVPITYCSVCITSVRPSAEPRSPWMRASGRATLARRGPLDLKPCHVADVKLVLEHSPDRVALEVRIHRPWVGACGPALGCIDVTDPSTVRVEDIETVRRIPVRPSPHPPIESVIRIATSARPTVLPPFTEEGSQHDVEGKTGLSTKHLVEDTIPRALLE